MNDLIDYAIVDPFEVHLIYRTTGWVRMRWSRFLGWYPESNN